MVKGAEEGVNMGGGGDTKAEGIREELSHQSRRTRLRLMSSISVTLLSQICGL